MKPIVKDNDSLSRKHEATERMQAGLREKPEVIDLLAKLNSQGAAVTHLQDIGASLSSFAAARQLLILELQKPQVHSHNSWDVQHHCYEITDINILRYAPEIYQMGTHPFLLYMAETYLGKPPILHNVTYRYEFHTDHQLGVRQWHRDNEVPPIFKAIIYLSDVDSSDGPYEYIPKSKTPWRGWFYLFPKKIRYSDQAMKRITPSQNWQKCIGKAGTVVLTDSAAVYHHGTNPAKYREAVTFTYFPTK